MKDTINVYKTTSKMMTRRPCGSIAFENFVGLVIVVILNMFNIL